MASLHTINKSPFERDSYASCLRLADVGSSILFIEDGVYAVLKGTVHSAEVEERRKDFSFYVLMPDLRARGFGGKDIMDGIKTIDYGGFVDLASSHDGVRAWL